VIARLADRVCVMRHGEYVEEGQAEALFAAPKSPYTRDLLDAIPRLDRDDRGGRPQIAPVADDAQVVLEASDVRVHFPVRQGVFGKPAQLRAVDGVDLTV